MRLSILEKDLHTGAILRNQLLNANEYAEIGRRPARPLGVFVPSAHARMLTQFTMKSFQTRALKIYKLPLFVCSVVLASSLQCVSKLYSVY